MSTGYDYLSLFTAFTAGLVAFVGNFVLFRDGNKVVMEHLKGLVTSIETANKAATLQRQSADAEFQRWSAIFTNLQDHNSELQDQVESHFQAVLGLLKS